MCQPPAAAWYGRGIMKMLEIYYQNNGLKEFSLL